MKRGRRSLLGWLAGAAVAAAALAAVVTWVPLHAWDDEARVIDRVDASRPWVHKGKTPGGLALRLAREDLGARSERRELAAVGDPRPPFACERIWILSRGRSRLLQVAGLALQDRLLAVPGLNEVAYFPLGDQPLGIVRPPDLFVVLEGDVERALVLPGYARLAAGITARVGRSAPLSGLDGAPSLELRAELAWSAVGLVSSFARYDALAGAIGAELDLESWIAEQRAEFGAVPSAPLALIDAHGAPPGDLPLSLADRERLYSQANLGLADESAWSMPLAGDGELGAWLEDARTALAGAGWTCGGGAWDPRIGTWVARRGERELAFQAVCDAEPGQPASPGAAQVLVHHRSWLPPGELAARCARHLRESGASEALRGALARLPRARVELLEEAAREAGLAGELAPLFPPR